ncbi:MAG TPA: gamma-glutamyltransferase family protein [Candidatus Dormibacteraeota bacterium]|nr:gamma-glutamyltransferase family protein [Candidatus Dormibacteraeota bacterium]
MDSHLPGRTRYGAQGMIATSSSESAAAGAKVLLEGGNAFDATVAAALVEGLTLPSSCGLGGDAFAVVYDAKSKRVYGIGGSGAAPLASTPERYRAEGYATVPDTGWRAVTVPGEADALWTLHQRFGSKPWDSLVEPAIRCAEEGIAMSDRRYEQVRDGRERFGAAKPGRVFMPDAPGLGQVWRRPDYGWTLRQLAEGGADAFYRGDVAAELVRCSEKDGWILTLEDLAAQRTDIYEPIHTDYRATTVWQTRPPSQGFVLLETLNLLEGFSVTRRDAARAHLMVEALKLAYADRLRYSGDPRVVDFSLDGLISKDFATRRREAIDPNHAAASAPGGEPSLLGQDTTSFCVADREGNMMSYIHSLFNLFGSGVEAGRTGLVLNNRGKGFSLEPDSPNLLAGGKRSMHTLNAYLITRDGEPWLVGNTPGGDMQVQWNTQVISDLVDLRMGLQEAIEAPRWHVSPGTDPALVGTPFQVTAGPRFGAAFVDELRARGHQVVEGAAWSGGAVQLVSREPSGVLTGGSDPRLSGVALGI